MPEDGDQQGQQAEEQQAQQGQAKSLEDLLAGLPEDQRGIVLGEVSKARGEAKNLRERLKAAEPKASEYDKLAEAQKTEAQKQADAIAAAERGRADAETRLLRFEVAAEKKLDPDLVQFLSGTTKEELETQADALLAKVAQARTVDLGQGVRGGNGQAPDMNSLLRAAAGRS